MTTAHPVEFERLRPGRWIAELGRVDALAVKAEGRWRLHIMAAASRCVSSRPLKSRNEAAVIAAAYRDRLDDESPTAEARMRFATREGLQALYPNSRIRC
ncbi:hypothetical protein [Rhodococcoides fascians]|uniref:hypothetical protein n=1 Tax=Rhodococcoides fascians TaxID=1828 RepID=UPI00050CFAB0|nr:hypothetical protein [Rhodococcus fascians]